MDKNDFCYSMGQELSTWKDRISAELKKIEQMDSGAKQKMLPIVEDFMMLETEMSARIQQFENECTPDYVPSKEVSEFKPDFSLSVGEVEKKIGAGDLGG